MASQIGTARSRVDGPAKVTGADNLAYAAVVSARVAKGRIVRMDVSGALAVEGVIDVLTHENRLRLPRSVIFESEGTLTVYDKTQGVQNVQRYIAGVFGLKPDNVRVLSPYVGGAFGSGLRPQYHLPLAVMAALALKRSVRLVLTRQQMFTFGYRPGTIQRLALGAKAGGTLDAIMHDAIATTSQYEDFHEGVTTWSGPLYKCANTKYSHKLARLDLATPTDMRAPGGVTGLYALECAMDELAVALRLDPLELRLCCYSDRDQDAGIPFPARSCASATVKARTRSDGGKRNPEPRSMREGNELVGFGMATGIWEAMQQKASARVVLTANGHAEVACAFTDIGPGTYTLTTQVAADRLGLRSRTSPRGSAIPLCRRRRSKAAPGPQPQPAARSRPGATPCARNC
jgi:xanthine dehydrogenase YagR molybdenum-binding subunit